MSDSRALTAHIHRLLDDYMRTYILAINYDEFIEQLVNELLSDTLDPVPISDHPQFLTLPSDPVDHFLRIYCPDDLEYKNETLHVEAEGAAFIKRLFRQMGQATECPASEKWLRTDSTWDHERLYFTPMSFELSLTAITDTPTLGSCARPGTVPQTMDDVLKMKSEGLLGDGADGGEDDRLLQLDLDDIPDTKPKLDSLMRSALQTICAVNPYLSTTANDDTKLVPSEQFYRRPNSPPLIPVVNYMQDPPIFPRVQARTTDSSKIMREQHSSRPELLSKALFKPPPVEVLDDDEDDLENEHTIVVNGWQAYEMPSSSRTPSLADSTSEMDELLLESPEPKGNADASKYEYWRPSQEAQADRRRTEARAIYIHKFITTTIGVHDEPQIVTTPRSSPTNMNLSVLGQPPTTVVAADRGSVPSELAPEQSDDDSYLNTTLLHPVIDEDITDIIAREQLDGVEMGFMDIPQLPSPNIHGDSSFMPKQLVDLVSAHSKTQLDEQAHHPRRFGFMGRIKGTKALNMELSWRPVRFETKVPSHEEIAQVTSLQNECNFHVGDVIPAFIAKGPDNVCIDEQRILRAMAKSPTARLEDSLHELFDMPLILTREERHRTARLQGFDLDTELERIIVEEDPADNSPELEYHIPSKRQNLGYPEADQYLTYEYCTSDTMESYYEDMQPDAVNDSGIILVETNTAYPRDNPIGYTTTPMLGFAEGLDLETLNDGSRPDDQLLEDPYLGTFSPLPLDSVDPCLTAISELVPPMEAHVPTKPRSDESASSNLPPSSIPNYSDTSSLRDSVPVTSGAVKEPTLWRGEDALTEFMELRAKQGSRQAPQMSSSDPLPTPPPIERHEQPIRGIPQEVLDKNTLTLPQGFSQPTTMHRFLASVALIQKSALVRYLNSNRYCIEVVERETLDGADLVLDPDIAVLYFSLLSLPSQCEALLSLLGELSWRYASVYVIFETYPVSESQRLSDMTRLAPYAFSAPVLRSIKKLRRDLGIAEAFDRKCPTSTIQFAFSESVDDTAMFTRIIGDQAEKNSQLMVWDERLWLTDEEQEDEHNLGCAPGMNAFAAAAILSQVSLDGFLDMSPDERLGLAPLIGHERMAHLNHYIASRIQTLSPSPME
ncbi:hypothetical protein EVG20_g1191 [Dentipellis fragilis]|uniref:Uncharacterized protein n=1 Tax=Dentipellis fragilis TaxID=205917 RepID=A0A4Y9ZBH1_9AGAM|nr:hypothetical protein EVG20_g1191 [Dentipellis fragilis]